MKTISANGIDIRYETSGNDPARPWVTLSHSLACDLTMWDGLAAALAPRCNVLRYDTRGHGGSGAPDGAYGFEQLAGDVVGLLDALGIERTHFVGLSMGGMIGQHFALLAPQRLDRLVIASSTSRIPPESGPVWEERKRKAREIGMAALVDETLGRWFTPGFAQRRPDIAAHEMARIGTQIAATPPAGYCGCAEAIQRLDITARIKDIRRPTLIIVGADDPGTPPAMSEVIAREIPGSRLEVIPAASHLCCIEQPEVFNRLVSDFIA